MSVALCPNCNGAKTVSRPPTVAGDREMWETANTELWPCPTCDAKGYLVLEPK